MPASRSGPSTGKAALTGPPPRVCGQEGSQAACVPGGVARVAFGGENSFKFTPVRVTENGTVNAE